MWDAWKRHWPEYLIEAFCLGGFMVSACAFTALLYHPQSPVALRIVSPIERRIIMGCGMGLTAFLLIYSPWGKRSGAHMNPAVTLTFWRLGVVGTYDALAYVVAQFIGGIAGTALIAVLLRPWIAHPAVNYAVTIPGEDGWRAAFIAELAISLILMFVILMVSNTHSIAGYAGLCAALLIAIYVAFESPISGMSMNPARTFGSAVCANVWTALWIYFTAPPLGMVIAADAYLRVRGAQSILCAKLHHHNSQRCIFRCGYAARAAARAVVTGASLASS
jgi:aquaporin Z